MKFPRAVQFRLDSLAWQVALVVAAWAYLCSLHWDNDGLWFQGDAPRHAANGLFWKEFLLNPSLDPKGYALSYYARYPVINPTAYPPVFYILEGTCFGLFGASPYVAKSLVLLFALMAALYTTAWLRRWIAADSGWMAALLPLLPGVVLYSHTIMLNVPAFAVGLAALYHARRWLEAPSMRQGCAAATLTVLAVLTYYQAAAIVFVMVSWLFALRGWRAVSTRRTLAVIGVTFLVLVPCVVIAMRWAPTHAGYLFPAADQVWTIDNWAYYPGFLYRLVSPHLLALAVLGGAAGLLSQRWRLETILLLAWLAVYYALFSYLPAKEIRYVLILCTPLVGLCAIALMSVSQAIGSLWPKSPGLVPATVLAGAVALVGTQTWLAGKQWLPILHGFREVAAFFEEVAPAEPVFYDGYYDGVFGFFVQSGDPGFQRRVVLGSKLLYAQAVVPGWRLRQFVSSPEEVLHVLRTRGGCRWLAIETSDRSEEVVPARLLRQAVQGPEFELVQSFPIFTPGEGRIDVYRLLAPIEITDEVDLPIPSLGDDVWYKVRPIRRGD
jgi:hypothetical protein